MAINLQKINESVALKPARQVYYEIALETDPANPRIDYDHLGTIAVRNMRWLDGVDHFTCSQEEWIRDLLIPDNCTFSYRIQKLYDYFYGRESWLKKIDKIQYSAIDHAMKTDFIILAINFRHHNSGVFCNKIQDAASYDFDCDDGYIYMSMANARKEWSGTDEEIRQKAFKYLEGEVKEYDQYLSGDVYGYVVKDKFTDDVLDSCWGFYGYDYCEQEAKECCEYWKTH